MHALFYNEKEFGTKKNYVNKYKRMIQIGDANRK